MADPEHPWDWKVHRGFQCNCVISTHRHLTPASRATLAHASRGHVRCHLGDAVPLIDTKRLAKGCLVAAISFVVVGLIFVRAGGSADLIVFGTVLVVIGFLFGYYAHKLNPRIVRRFFDD